ncbi:hypothetical protein [Oceaniferula spumae]
MILIYSVCGVSLSIYGYKKTAFDGVQSWPSVPATQVEEDQFSGEIRGDWYDGTKTRGVSSTTVSYQYCVEGSSYTGTLATPDGGGLPFNFDMEFLAKPNEDGSYQVRNKPREWRAYYHPSDPSLAVLDPVPYRGVTCLIVASVMGVIIIAHLYFSIWG